MLNETLQTVQSGKIIHFVRFYVDIHKAAGIYNNI